MVARGSSEHTDHRPHSLSRSIALPRSRGPSHSPARDISQSPARNDIAIARSCAVPTRNATPEPPRPLHRHTSQVSQLLTEHWNLKLPRFVISVTGGATSFELPPRLDKMIREVRPAPTLTPTPPFRRAPGSPRSPLSPRFARHRVSSRRQHRRAPGSSRAAQTRAS